MQTLKFHPMLGSMPQILPADRLVYLVGGGVRDAVLGKYSNDLDFAVSSGGIEIAKTVAAALKGHFYPLDYERDYGRVIVLPDNGDRLLLDFTPFQGGDLETDLRGRDFTMNALAVDVRQPEKLLDPLGGLSDLHSKTLRACSPGAISSDPIRILRAIRFAASFELMISEETRQFIRQATPKLVDISAERLRDEIFRILGGPKPGAALRVLDTLGATTYILPELLSLKGVKQPPPHIYDVWDHSLKILDNLEIVLGVLATDSDPENYANLHFGAMSVQLGRFREKINAHLAARLVPDRSRRSLFFLASLYHDIGKPRTQTIDEFNRIQFLGHEKTGAELVSQRGHRLKLSSAEIDHLIRIVSNHMRPLWLAESGKLPSRRSIYRFFRSAGDAGVEVCLLSLADTTAIFGPGLPPERWSRLLEVVRILLLTWWEGPFDVVRPEPLVNGRELISEFGLAPGPLIGRVLEALREAQAAGEINSRIEALKLAGSVIAKENRN
jgi:putative nucleotidyltransferase with HDIG domain